MVNGPEAAPSTMAAPTIHSLLLATMQTGRSLESSQIQDCNSGKLSKAFHASIATVTAVRRELCFRKGKKNQNHNNWGEPERAPHEREVWCQDVQYICMCVYLVRRTSRRARVHACAKR